MPSYALYLLGPPRLEVDGSPAHIGRRKALALLAYLAVTDRAHTRDALATLLWPEWDAPSARAELRRQLALLHALLGPAGIEADRETVQLNPDFDLRLDVTAFRAQLAACAGHGHAPSEACPDCVPLLEGAVALHTGAFMAGFTLGDSAAFDEWQFFEAEALKDEAASALVRLATYFTSQGDFDRAIGHARRWLAVDPLHEPAHRHLMVLYARSNQRAAALRQYETCRRVLREELGAEPSARTQETYQQILRGDAVLAPTAVEAVLEHEARVVGPCPYRGLAAFGEADAPFFFGREAFVEQLERAVAAPPYLTAVVGSSGSGKSSVVFAGLLPRLCESGDWLLITLRPGAQPFQSLATALIPALEPDLRETARLVEGRYLAAALAGGDISLGDVVARIREKDPKQRRVLLFIDQFEELYTLCPDAGERLRFTGALLTVPQSGATSCLLTLRADFMGQALANRPFADALQPAVKLLGPMTPEELRAAIEKPAEKQGAAFEAGLVARVLDDVGEEPGNLPLLEFALTLLWERLDFGWLTHAAYEVIGRVEGALARYADEVFDALSSTEQALARRIFTQLVQPGEGTEDTRRVATRANVGEAAWDVVQHLADRRLVVTGRDETTGTETVEVIHEALIRSWGQLQGWMSADRAFRTWQEQLRLSLRTWESTGHDEGALLRGAPLAEAETWLRLRAVDLGQAERTFVEEGLALRGRRAAEREAQRQAELEAARRLQEAHGVALRQAAIGLASEARLQMQGPNQDLAVLLALEAVGAYPYTWQAELALAEIVCDFRLVWRFAHGVPVMWPAQVAPDGTKFLTASNDGVLRVFDLATGKNLLTVQAYEGVAANWHRARWSPSGDRILTHSPYSGTPRVWDAQSGELLVECVADGNSLAEWDGTRIVTYRMDRVVRIWDARTGEQLHALTGIEDQYVSLSPDGKWIATWTGQIWDAETGELAYTLAECEEAIAQGERSWFSWSPDGARLGTGIAGTAWVWDAATGEEVLALQTGYRGKADLRWSLDGRRLLVTGYTGDDSRAAIWDAANGEKLRELPFTDGLFYPIEPWSPQGDRIAVPDAQGHVTIYDAYSGVEVLRLPVGTDRPCVTWLPDGSGFATAGDDLARIWRIAAPGFTLSSERDTPPDTWEGPNIAAWSPDDTRIARPFDDGSVRVWDAASRRECVRITRGIPRPGIAINWVAWSPDSGRILTGGGDGGVEIWDAASGARVLRLAGHGDVALDEHWSVGHVVMGLAWSPDGMRALTTGRDHRAVIWDTATGAVLREFPGREYYDGAWSPDGRRVALCDQFGYGGPVKVWDAETGEALLTLLPDDFGYGTSGVAWSPDGTRIVTFSLDGVGRLWDAATGALVGTFAVRDFCSGAQWSPTGDRFLVGSYGVGVRVWDAATLQQVAGYPGGPSGSTGSWSPDGTAIAIGYANGDTKVYPAWESLEELIAYAKAHCVLRELTPEERAQYGLPER